MPFPGGNFRATTAVRGRGAVFAIGRRVFVAGTARQVTLTDDTGTSPVGRLGRGTEVEIVAWRPLGSQGTRYLVRSVGDVMEGWLAVGNLSGSRVLGGAAAAPRQVPR